MRGRSARWAIPLVAILVLGGCPYSSEHPLSDPGTAGIDSTLVGNWKWQDPETHEWVTMSFFPFDEHELVAFTPGDKGEPSDAYRVFVTTIDTERFLNVQQLGAKENREWFFVHYRIDGDRLTLRFVEDELFGSTPFSSPEALQGFVRANLADPRLYASGDTERPEMNWQRAGT